MLKRPLLALLTLILLAPLVYAQNNISSFWLAKDVAETSAKTIVEVAQHEIYQLDLERITATLSTCVQRQSLRGPQDYVEMQLPLFGEGMQRFAMMETPIMESRLQAKYPNIRTYTGQGLDNPRQTIKVDVGPHGFHAMVFSDQGSYLIEPAYKNDMKNYMSFKKQDALVSKKDFTCLVDDTEISSREKNERETFFANPTGEQLRTYRLALATTGEYSTYHGGTKELVLAAMVTAMNRVNGIYEKDLTITTILVNNTDTLIFLDAATDPFTNNDGATMLTENNNICNALIGSDSFDIGHVFSTGGGGIARLGSVCGQNKGSGVTGSSDPVGDPFTVDYVAHEIGHQFDANHTFNSCGGQGPQPYEPGSGVTIMGYASLCGTFDLADHSIDIFHVANYDEIIAFSQSGDGDVCATKTETGNTAPVVDVGAGGFFIPYQTPFELTGTAEDAEGDSLTFGWEQYDLGPPTHPDDALGTAPLFRSWIPETVGTRTFPRIQNILSNGQTIGELLPQFGREMNFRLTVRDNVAGGGGADYEQLTFQVADNAGPFVVNIPDGTKQWQAGYLEPVTWLVANTDQPPVNCDSVDILLSDDGGFTFPYELATKVPNTGYAIVRVPDAVGIRNRVKVKAANNVFFDISPRNFFIRPTTLPDFIVATNSESEAICGEATVEYEIRLDTVLGYDNTLNLSVLDNPAGTDISFSNNDVLAPETVTLSVTPSSDVLPGDYVFTLLITGDTVTKELPLELSIRAGVPAAANLSTPLNGQKDVDENSILTWDTIPLANSYTVEISNTADFSFPIYIESGITETIFDPAPNFENNTVYFWRVRGNDVRCGNGAWSSVYSFQTELSACSVYNSSDVGQDIPSPGTLISELNVTQDFVVTDVNVINLVGDHRRVGQLVFKLNSPEGNSVTLIDQICGNDNDFNLGLDDDGLPGPIPCAPVDGQSYQPVDSLATFNGSRAIGIWQLEIQDSIQQTRGGLASWGLELCGPPPIPDEINLALGSGLVMIGDTLALSQDHINADCGSGSASLEYIITGLPTSGSLFLNGNAVEIGSILTQADIDDNLLIYINDGLDLDPDQFEFIIRCDDGPYLGGQVFHIIVDMMSNTFDVNPISFSIYPNPASEYVELHLTEVSSASYEIVVVDLLGRRHQTQPIFSNMTTMATSNLSNGIYFCQIRMDGVVLGEQKLMVMH
jgi:subtilisin-like proprotein convertase family protein